MGGKLTILGCGGSAGVPSIGNWWGACDPNEPRNRRTRPSIALQTDTTLVIIDTGPDFREQMNRENLGFPDAVLITHVHSDHVNGLDELRILQRMAKRKFPVYADALTLEKLYIRMGYMFTSTEDGLYPAVCDPVVIEPTKPITVGDITLIPFEQDHGAIASLGFRIGNIGYSTDMRTLNDTALEILRGVDIWIADGNGSNTNKNYVHASSNDVAELNKTIGARKVFLTHLPPMMDYQMLRSELPENFKPCYDGMTIEWTD